jgi:hypothetical protein
MTRVLQLVLDKTEGVEMTRNLLTALVAVISTGALASSAFAAVPSNTAAPDISGTVAVGQTLTVSNGMWTGSPTMFSYQWQRCSSSTSCTDITGATNRTYTVAAADNGSALRAQVTASNADGKSTAAAAQTAVVGVPANTLKPAVLGDAVVGQELTATRGRWTNSPTSFAFHWLRCDADGTSCGRIFGATGRTYGVRAIDADNTLRVAVTATNANGSATERSDATDVVQSATTTVRGNRAPTIVFLSVRRTGNVIYARFRVCDDSAKRVTVVERDVKPATLAYTRRFSVVPLRCVVATRHWVPAPRFRKGGRVTFTLRAIDKSHATSRFVSRSLMWR